MSILEAMSYGVPVIGSKTGGIVEIIDDGKDGFLVPSGDANGFVKKCLLIFQDVKMRNRIGAAAREKILSSFSVQSCAEAYYKIYRQLLHP